MTLIDCLALHCHSTTVGGTLPDGEGSCRACVEPYVNHVWIWPALVIAIPMFIWTCAKLVNYVRRHHANIH